jgi:parallel beta-helix repeat protein
MAAIIVLTRPNHDPNSLQVTSPQATSPQVASPQVASPQVASPQVASLQLGGPASASAGDMFTFMVTAQDAHGKTASGYTGTVHFTSSDSQAVLPANYAFTSTDKGVHTFSATLKTAGSQTVTATDTVTASITGSAAVSINAATGTFYYVSATGSDSNPGTLAASFRTINHAVSFLHPGDTLYIRGGTYNESLNDVIPSGTSWSAPVTIAAYTGETVILQPPAGASRGIFIDNASYVQISNLIIDGSLISSKTADGVKISYQRSAYAHDIHITGGEIRNFSENGILITQNTAVNANGLVGHNVFLNVSIHNNGTTAGHGIYMETSDSAVTGCTIYNNGEYGIHVYDGDAQVVAGDKVNCARNVITGNCLYGNGFGLHSNRRPSNGGGITVWFGESNVLYNNLCYGNAGAGIKIDDGASNTRVYNNTVYNNQGKGDLYGIDLGANGSVTNTVVENNISYLNGAGNYRNSGRSTTQDHNLFGVDPLFVNAARKDFRLQARSPAIGAGIALPAVTTDIDGVARPKEGACDNGAYESKKR